MSCIIIDNGAGRLKFGRYDTSSKDDNISHIVPTSFPNCSAKINKQMQVLVGDDIDSVVNGSVLQFNRPFDHGYLNNWGNEIEIWDRMLSNRFLNITNCSDTSVVLTESVLNPIPWQNETNEVIYEYYSFKSYVRKPSSWFSSYNYSQINPLSSKYPDCSLVIDSGFSFSHSIPYINAKCQKESCKRVNIGGKLLTNYLKTIISYRQWNMMDEFKLMDQVKEDLCFISLDFQNELKKLKNSRNNSQLQCKDPFNTRLKKYFVLPDFQKVNRGFVKPDDEPLRPQDGEQVLTMESERFSVPELLFSPSDIGILLNECVDAW